MCILLYKPDLWYYTSIVFFISNINCQRLFNSKVPNYVCFKSSCFQPYRDSDYRVINIRHEICIKGQNYFHFILVLSLYYFIHQLNYSILTQIKGKCSSQSIPTICAKWDGYHLSNIHNTF